MNTNPLIQHPPRLSDLRGEELQQALRDRHERYAENWRRSRTQRTIVDRVRDWWAA
jgi:hypothetical protein